MARQSFIDWLKAIGMLAIVIGHVVGSPYEVFNLVSQPVYTKQLGVCFFIFIMGWSLAHEHSTSFKVVFKRVFPVYFYGLVFALILSGIYFITINDINESNYLPFFLGINVFFNHFPANPTTWYIGTYLHILLLWFAFFRGHQITKRHLLISIIIEISIRALFLYLDKDFVAYMFIPNWLTVFMLGGYLYQKKDTQWQPKTVALVLGWAIIVALWASPLNSLFSSNSFPFRELMTNQDWAPLLRSSIISIVYVGNTYVFFEIFRRLPRSSFVEFFARNSLITFIIHMPLIYALSEVVFPYFDAQWAKKLTLILIIFIGSAIISEIIQRVVSLRYFQNKTWDISIKLLTTITNKKNS
jgi:fucose 4-O-acetylase-like acetyltransferase